MNGYRVRSQVLATAAAVGLAAGLLLVGAGPSAAAGACDVAPCSYDDGAEVFNVKAYGAVGDEASNDTAAIVAANEAATQAQGIVFFPPGRYRISQPVMATASWHGSGVADTLLMATKPRSNETPFPAGAYAVTLENPDRHLLFYNLRLTGPTGAVKAVRAANLQGLAVNTPATVRRISVDRFDQGITLNSGHVVMEMVQSAPNYAGVYVNTSEPGIFITGSVLTSNKMASIVSPANVTITRLRMDRVHLGNSPYAIYQEKGTGPGWMDGVSLEQTPFEAIGNAAIFTENVDDAVTSRVSDLFVESGGMTFKGKASTYGIPTRPDDYAVVLGSTAGSIHLTSVLAETARQVKGNYSIKDHQGSLEIFRHNLFDRPPYDIAMEVGGRPDLVQLSLHNIRVQRSTGTIPAGARSTVVSTGSTTTTGCAEQQAGGDCEVSADYLGPAESILPFVQRTGTGGSDQQLTLVVSNVESAPTSSDRSVRGYTRFTVSVVGELPTDDVDFTWQIGDDLT